jgi:hypothetical protein
MPRLAKSQVIWRPTYCTMPHDSDPATTRRIGTAEGVLTLDFRVTLCFWAYRVDGQLPSLLRSTERANIRRRLVPGLPQ